MEAHGHVIHTDHCMLPEAQLWTEVVIQAIQDLASKDPRARSSAQEWFASDNDEVGDFIWVCNIMSVEPGVVRAALAKGTVLEASQSLPLTDSPVVRKDNANTYRKRRQNRKGHGGVRAQLR
ncbi:MAG: hypothetical protein GEU77_20070 [Deltaproteobacteria bacterium]|nr:hypothetical protein [Deltaproteobacteria bacterium]